MAVLIHTMECYPKPLKMGDIVIAPAPEVAHDKCTGGESTPGVIDGWFCPCPCHQKKPEPTPDPAFEAINKWSMEVTAHIFKERERLWRKALDDGLPTINTADEFIRFCESVNNYIDSEVKRVLETLNPWENNAD